MAWTKEQQFAIDDHKGSLLVSAAAGSGKTAVLVERVIQMLTTADEEKRVDADKLLVVTFTEAAAAEMRERISAKLSELSVNPNFEKIVEKQMVLLDKANISTIDAFCIRLVRENFNLLGISPDFRIADSTQTDILHAMAMRDTLKDCYEKGDRVFLELCELLNSFRDDSALIKTIGSIYSFTRSHPFYRDWLKKKLSQYENSIEDVAKSPWARVLYPICEDALQVAETLLEFAIDEVGEDPKLVAKLFNVLEEKKAEVKSARKFCEDENLDGLYKVIRSVIFPNFPSIPKYEDPDRLELIKKRWADIKGIFETLGRLVCSDASRFKEDLIDLLPKIKKLFEITTAFADRLDELKAERNLADFADVEQYALDLLLARDGEGYKRTPLAISLSESFAEILLDECQDSNELQDMLFKALSKDESNMFLVGDVKQSIYRFRQAMPELFVEKKNKFFEYNGKDYPAAISLSKNFRSREEVTSTVNFFFDQLMSRGMGGIDYTAERLERGAEYAPSELCNSELVYLELQTGDNRHLISAKYVANKINELMKVFTVTEKGGAVRPARYGDFCILLRAPKGSAQHYIDVLESEGIPASFQETPGILTSIEVSILLALLRVIDNPTLDLDMLTVLYSDLFGFTSDDITKLRLLDRSAPLYKLIDMAVSGEDEDLKQKSIHLLNTIEKFRLFCVNFGVAEVIDYIYRELNLPEFFSIKYKNPSKAANLSIFRRYAEGLEKNDLCSLSAFLRHIDRLLEQESDIKGAPTSQAVGSSVQIMSIHHSKGLEYPVCFVCDLSKQFNKQDLKGNTALHSSLGFSCVRRDEKTRTQSPTIALTASKIANEEAMLSEELRLLYVAMTRAREKLILVATAKDPLKEIQSVADKVISTSHVISPFTIKSCNSYAKWITLCASRHPALSDYFDHSVSRYVFKNTDCKLDVSIISRSEDGDEAEVTEKALPDSAKILDYEEVIRKNLTLKYQHQADTELPTKISVSEISKSDAPPVLRVPNFDEEKELSAAQRGTAIHTFMQFADYKAAKENRSLEVERLVSQGFITQKQADVIDFSKINAFFESSIAEAIFSADKIYREFRFMMPSKARDIFGVESDAEIMVQGIADCIIKKGDEFIILDYKSDAVRDISVLKDRYQKQLSLYREAIGSLFEAKKVRSVIYSFTLSDFIEV